jgi:ADP-ribose pyrophosphatase YjhB (NUDIX family)
MTRLIVGERIGGQGEIRFGCSAAIFASDRQKILLTRRADNGTWCLPSGGMEPGESISETCQREVREETGLNVRVTRLIGVYSSPDRLVVYPDGNHFQLVGISFESEIEGGELVTSDETTDFGYFTLEEAKALEVMEHHRERIRDAFKDSREPFIR